MKAKAQSKNIQLNHCFSRDETHHRPLLTRLGSLGLVKKANVVGEDDLVSEYLMSRLSCEYVIFHDKTQ